MKILAAVMDVVFVKPWFKEFRITKIKRFLVYDPVNIIPIANQEKKTIKKKR